MATHSSVLAWRIPWTEKPDGLRLVHGVAKSQIWLGDFEFKKKKVEIKLRSLHYSHINATALKLKMSQPLKIVDHYVGTPDTYKILYINYTSIKKFFLTDQWSQYGKAVFSGELFNL